MKNGYLAEWGDGIARIRKVELMETTKEKVGSVFHWGVGYVEKRGTLHCYCESIEEAKKEIRIGLLNLAIEEVSTLADVDVDDLLPRCLRVLLTVDDLEVW